jgi:predicted nucleic acid-binding protein
LIVIDASAAVAWLVQSESRPRLAARLLDAAERHAPAVFDLEVLATLRRMTSLDRLAASRAQAAVDATCSMALHRHDHAALLPRIWSLRRNVTPYDAAYVALAEALGAPLITLDRRLAAAPGIVAKVELYE